MTHAHRATVALLAVLLVAACGDTPPGPSGQQDAGADTRVADTGVDATRDTIWADTVSADTATGDTTPADTTADTGPDLPKLKICNDATPPSDLKTVDWNNLTSGAVAAMDPNHSAIDALFNLESRVELEGKFTYGSVSKDLEGERIEVWMDDCSGDYRKLGEVTTNSDGRAKLSIPPGAFDGPGVFDLWFRVMGDNSTTTATLRLLPKGTEIVVFDIDGTLTQGNRELGKDIISDVFEPIASGDYVPKTRSGAARITEVRRFQRGYQLFYITARPYWLTKSTRKWLQTRGMAPGAVRFTRSNADSLPTQGATGEYKRDNLQRLVDQGFELVAAYGNSDTDIWAYEKAGIAKDQTFILGDQGGKHNTVDLGKDYNQHLQDLRMQMGEADQPFVY